MSETLNVLKTRRSCRAYKPDPVEDEKLNAIIEAGTYAATGMGKQSPIIIVVKDKALRDKLMKMNAAIMGMDIDPFYGAPELLIVLADKAMPTYIYDGSEEGKAILKELGIEGDYEGIGHLILGYAAKPLPDPKPRKANYVYRA